MTARRRDFLSSTPAFVRVAVALAPSDDIERPRKYGGNNRRPPRQNCTAAAAAAAATIAYQFTAHRSLPLFHHCMSRLLQQKADA